MRNWAGSEQTQSPIVTPILRHYKARNPAYVNPKTIAKAKLPLLKITVKVLNWINWIQPS